jgi:N-methylhydantoinase B
LREDVIAPGEWRGGIGSVRVFTYLTDGGFSVEGDGQKHRPWGFDGGTDGLPGELIMETKAGTRLAPLEGALPEGRAR